MEERRKFIRLNSSFTVGYKRLESQETEKQTFSRNISEGGICLVVDEELGVSELLDLNLYLPGKREVVSVTGRVVWIKEFPSEDEFAKRTFRAGIEFLNIEKSVAKKIDEYVRAALLEDDK